MIMVILSKREYYTFFQNFAKRHAINIRVRKPSVKYTDSAEQKSRGLSLIGIGYQRMCCNEDPTQAALDFPQHNGLPRRPLLGSTIWTFGVAVGRFSVQKGEPLFTERI